MYKVIFEKKALKLFAKLDGQTQRQILKYLKQQDLLQNPKSFGKPLLREKKGNWRYRVGSHRIICKILDDELIILVVDARHRKQIYD